MLVVVGSPTPNISQNERGGGCVPFQAVGGGGGSQAGGALLRTATTTLQLSLQNTNKKEAQQFPIKSLQTNVRMTGYKAATIHTCAAFPNTVYAFIYVYTGINISFCTKRNESNFKTNNEFSVIFNSKISFIDNDNSKKVMVIHMGSTPQWFWSLSGSSPTINTHLSVIIIVS